MRIQGLFVLFVLLVLGACTGTQKNANNKDIHCRNFVEDRTPISLLENLTFSDVKIDQNCLNVTVNAPYCDINTSDFDLVWNGVATRSLPPQINMSLRLSTKKSCKKTNTFHLKYNLSALRKFNSKGKIYITLNGYNKRIEYTY